MARVLPVLPPTGEPAGFNDNYILYWNNVSLDLERLATSLFAAPNNDPPSSARALAIASLAVHDAYFAIRPSDAFSTYLTTDDANTNNRLPAVPANADPRTAVAGAATMVLNQLFATPRQATPTAVTAVLGQFIQNASVQFPNLNTTSPSYFFGTAVGRAVLNVLDQGGAPFDQDGYRPTQGRYRFDDDPTNPIRIVPIDVNEPEGPTRAIRVYSSPFYGFVGRRIASQEDHLLGDPPVGFGVNNVDEYDFAFTELINQGGAQALNTTRRRPDQTTTGFFWAYDGANLIGNPPRHYNQILRQIAVDRKPAALITDEANNADFARLFAIANSALGEAGVFAWLGKYTFEFWRPLTGVRQDPQNPRADPFWLAQAAPETNTNNIAFKPPFPAYPSGHATFGGAIFQAVRLYYKGRDNLDFADDAPDNISFTAISDELNGISRDLRPEYNPSQPITDQLGTVRSNITRRFSSLWEAIFDNAISRVYLGVHWGFDSFPAADVSPQMQIQADGTVDYLDTNEIRYNTTGPRSDRPGQLFPLGGVPLGIEIANDIVRNGLRQANPDIQPSGIFVLPGGGSIPSGNAPGNVGSGAGGNGGAGAGAPGATGRVAAKMAAMNGQTVMNGDGGAQ